MIRVIRVIRVKRGYWTYMIQPVGDNIYPLAKVLSELFPFFIPIITVIRVIRIIRVIGAIRAIRVISYTCR